MNTILAKLCHPVDTIPISGPKYVSTFTSLSRTRHNVTSTMYIQGANHLWIVTHRAFEHVRKDANTYPKPIQLA